jgi:hypothetical protein
VVEHGSGRRKRRKEVCTDIKTWCDAKREKESTYLLTLTSEPERFLKEVTTFTLWANTGGAERRRRRIHEMNRG